MNAYKPHACSLCDRAFSRKYDLERHERNVHPEDEEDDEDEEEEDSDSEIEDEVSDRESGDDLEDNEAYREWYEGAKEATDDMRREKYEKYVDDGMDPEMAMEKAYLKTVCEYVQVDAFSNDTIATIRTKAGIPPDTQLFYDALWLEDHDAIRTYRIENGAELRAELERDMILKCLDVEGNNMPRTVRVCPSHTLKDLKAMLRRGILDIPSESQLTYDSTITDGDYRQMSHTDETKLLIEFSMQLNIYKDQKITQGRICSSQTISEVKTKFKLDTILNNGVEMEDHLTVSECGIKDNNTLQGLHWISLNPMDLLEGQNFEKT
ncbi:uncharacterized protein [Amphiura filiformis]|uniref:uncharacterized protein n=1 Tax=Amphiura filiformis TaxID=82378 RepID=UPI003B220E7D